MEIRGCLCPGYPDSAWDPGPALGILTVPEILDHTAFSRQSWFLGNWIRILPDSHSQNLVCPTRRITQMLKLESNKDGYIMPLN